MVDTILLVDDIFDLSKLHNDISTIPELRIFSLNYDAHKKLLHNKIPHVIGETYLTDADYGIIDNSTINTTISWSNFEPVKSMLTFNDIDLANSMEIELLTYFSRIYLSIITIVKIIESERPKKIIASTYLNDYVMRLCNEKKIEVTKYDQTEQPSLYFDTINIKFNLGVIPISFNISRKKYMMLKHTVEKFLYGLFNFYPNTKNETILLLDFNPSQFDILVNELSKLQKNILFLNQRRPAIHNLGSFMVMKNSRCKIMNLNIFANDIDEQISNETKKMKDNLENIWSFDSKFEKVFSYDKITFWYSIKEHFKNICSVRFIESVRRILLLQQLFKEFKISIILEWAEAGQEEKETLAVAKKHGVKSIMLQHGKYPTSKKWDPFARFLAQFPHRLQSDFQAVWGTYTKNYALSLGYDEKNLLVTGSPRHDNFFNVDKHDNKTKTILLATTGPFGMAADCSTTQNRLTYDSFVKEVCRVVANLDGYRILVKPHPHFQLTLDTIALIKEIDPKISITHSMNLPKLIDECDLLITFTNSTITLESIILNKPTILMMNESWAKDEEIVRMGAVLPIDNIEQIEDGIKNMLFNKEFVNKIQDNAKKFLDIYMSNKGNASKILCGLLDKF